MVDEALHEQQILIDEDQEAFAPAAAGAVAPAPAAADIYEDDRGNVYMRGRAKPLGKVSFGGTSISAKCQIHSRCSRPYSFRKLPPGQVLHDWLRAGLGVSSAQEHYGLPKPMV